MSDSTHQIEVLTHLRALSQRILTIAALYDLTLAARFADASVLVQDGRLTEARRRRCSAPSACARPRASTQSF